MRHLPWPCTIGLLAVALGASCGDDGSDEELDAANVSATGIWDIESGGSTGPQTVRARYAGGAGSDTLVDADTAQAIALELLPLPISGRVKVGLRAEADAAANTVTLTLVDQRGRRFGRPATLAPGGGAFSGELIIEERGAVPSALSAAFLIGLGAGPECAVGQQSGLQIEMAGDGATAEMTQFSRLTLQSTSDGACQSVLQQEVDATGGAAAGELSPLGHAIQSGAISSGEATALTALELSTPVTARRLSTDAPPKAEAEEGSFDPEEDNRALPIELELPALVGAGSPMVIKGYIEATARPEDRELELTVEDPDGTATELSATADAMGLFSAPFDKTGVLGTYEVTATQGANAIEVTGTFEVVALGSVNAAIKDGLQAALAVGDEVVALLEEVLAGLPPSAERDELTGKLDAAKGELAQGRSKIDEVVITLDPILVVAEEQPALAGHLAPDLQELSTWAAEGESLRDKWRGMLDRAKMQPTLCDTIEYGGEAFAALSTAMNFTGKGVGILINIAADKLLPVAINALPFSGPDAEAQKFMVTEASKSLVSLGQGMASWVTGFVGIATDLGVYATQQLMKAYCVRFEGPLSAAYTETWFEELSEWARMIQKLNGKIVVRYPKGASGSGPIQVTGHIEGNATKFDFWEHYELVDDPAQYNLIELIAFSILPVAAPFDVANGDPGFGMFARMAMPAYFNIPIQGEIQGDKLAIKLLDATLDYSDVVKYTLVVALFEPITLIPQVFTFDFPARKAATVLSGAMEAPFEVKLVVNQSDKTTMFERSLTKDRELSEGVTQQWSFTIQAKSKN